MRNRGNVREKRPIGTFNALDKSIQKRVKWFRRVVRISDHVLQRLRALDSDKLSSKAICMAASLQRYFW